MSNSVPKNVLLDNVEYKIRVTELGRWQSYVYPSGELFEEFISHKSWRGWPLIHYTRGRCPETGKRIVAKGVVAIGRLAVGVVAIGHASAGIIAIGQLGLGLVLGLGQATTGFLAIGQVAIALGLGIGQFAIGYAAIGQLAVGVYAMGQAAVGVYVWDMKAVAPEAKRFFAPWL